LTLKKATGEARSVFGRAGKGLKRWRRLLAGKALHEISRREAFLELLVSITAP